MMRVGSLFAGIGGFDLGLERAGFEIAWQVEIDPYCQRVLAKHWPGVPRYGDIRAIDWATVPAVDVLCGGFPCQDLSFAGKRAGIDGERSGLWSEYVRAIRALRPRFIIVENVPGLLTNEHMGRVLGDLAQMGFDAEWTVLSACAFGASHPRERVFIVAYPSGVWGLQRGWLQQSKDSDSQRNLCTVAYQPEPVRVAARVPHRMDRLRALGNSVVPQIVTFLGERILACERDMRQMRNGKEESQEG